MRSAPCDDVCSLIDREAGGWTEAERLRVEQHLGGCASCSETLSIARFVTRTMKEAAGELSESARKRAIQAAFKQAERTSTRLQIAPRRPGWPIAAGLLAAAAVLLWLVRAPEPAREQPRASALPAQKADAAAAKPESAREPLPPQPEIVESESGESRTLAHAQVTFAPATRARFDPTTHTLTLEHGAIDVEVDSSKRELFVVVTQNFRVEVLGTRFSVTPEAVIVQRGRVRVVDPSGNVLAAALTAGQRYPQPSQTRAVSATSASTASAHALLDEARGALARDQIARAKELVRAAERAHPGRADRAEAGTLRAELALLEHDSRAAADLYRELAARYPELPAGENAAFAAAQLAVKLELRDARRLLDGYLTRYPSGRFVDEVKAHLQRLDAR